MGLDRERERHGTVHSVYVCMICMICMICIICGGNTPCEMLAREPHSAQHAAVGVSGSESGSGHSLHTIQITVSRVEYIELNAPAAKAMGCVRYAQHQWEDEGDWAKPRKTKKARDVSDRPRPTDYIHTSTSTSTLTYC